MDKKKIINIKNILESTENIENMTAREIAKLAGVSPATLSRRIKQLGYTDFTDFKYRLRQDCQKTSNFKIAKNIKYTGDIEISEILEIMKQEKFGLSSLPKFNNLLYTLGSYLKVEHIDFRYVYIQDKFDLGCNTVVHFGKIDPKYINPDVNYIQISFQELVTNNQYPNIRYLNLELPNNLKLNKFVHYYEGYYIHNIIMQFIEINEQD